MLAWSWFEKRIRDVETDGDDGIVGAPLKGNSMVQMPRLFFTRSMRLEQIGHLIPGLFILSITRSDINTGRRLPWLSYQ